MCYKSLGDLITLIRRKVETTTTKTTREQNNNIIQNEIKK